jgi:hypothetical protein
MMIFNNIYFSQNLISLFGGLFNDETDLRGGKVLTFVENRLNSMNEISAPPVSVDRSLGFRSLYRQAGNIIPRVRVRETSKRIRKSCVLRAFGRFRICTRPRRGM